MKQRKIYCPVLDAVVIHSRSLIRSLCSCAVLLSGRNIKHIFPGWLQFLLQPSPPSLTSGTVIIVLPESKRFLQSNCNFLLCLHEREGRRSSKNQPNKRPSAHKLSIYFCATHILFADSNPLSHQLHRVLSSHISNFDVIRVWI